MILEVATLSVKDGLEAEFEAAFKKASRIIASAKGYGSHELWRCIETRGKYVLLVRWESVEDHTVGFKESAEYQEFRKAIHPFYVSPPAADHFDLVEANG